MPTTDPEFIFSHHIGDPTLFSGVEGSFSLSTSKFGLPLLQISSVLCLPCKHFQSYQCSHTNEKKYMLHEISSKGPSIRSHLQWKMTLILGKGGLCVSSTVFR